MEKPLLRFEVDSDEIPRQQIGSCEGNHLWGVFHHSPRHISAYRTAKVRKSQHQKKEETMDKTLLWNDNYLVGHISAGDLPALSRLLQTYQKRVARVL